MPTLTDSMLSARKAITQSIMRALRDLATSAATAMPVGSMIDYLGGSLPGTGEWLEAIGQSLVRADYPELFAKIGTTWGAVDGTHFSLPDFRGRVSLGASSSGSPLTDRVLGSTGGAETHTLTGAESPAHDHGGVPYGVSGGGPAVVQGITNDSTPSGHIGITSFGGGGPHNNMQPWAAVTKIVRVR